MWKAINYGEEKAVLKLIEEGFGNISLNGTNIIDQTPLHVACQEGQLSLVRLLINKGAAVNAQDNELSSPLHYACQEGHVAIALTLLENGANVDDENIAESTPLHYAAQHGYLELVLILISEGANLNARDAEGNSPLELASLDGFTNVATVLLDKGADIDVPGLEDGKTLLMKACSNGFVKLVEILIDRGAIINVKDNRLGFSPLHLASQSGYADIVEILINHGAHLNAVDQEGHTALHLAVKFDRKKIVLLLLDNGIHAHLLANGKSALDMARARGHTEVVQVLETYLAPGLATSEETSEAQRESVTLFASSKSTQYKIQESTDDVMRKLGSQLSNYSIEKRVKTASDTLDNNSHSVQLPNEPIITSSLDQLPNEFVTSSESDQLSDDQLADESLTDYETLTDEFLTDLQQLTNDSLITSIFDQLDDKSFNASKELASTSVLETSASSLEEMALDSLYKSLSEFSYSSEPDSSKIRANLNSSHPGANEHRANVIEQSGLLKTLEFWGIAEKVGENLGDFLKRWSKDIGLVLGDGDVLKVIRTSVESIEVEFKDEDIARNCLKTYESHDSRIEIRPKMTEWNKRLFRQVKEFAHDNNYQKVWFENGRIHLQKDENAHVIIM